MIISIIIPVYNTLPFLDQCVQSVLNQNMKDWECFLVDDGSTDGSGERCDWWATKDGRISVIHQQNKGVSAARNAGLEKVKGQYIAFVDSDDWMDSDCLQLLFDRIKCTRADMSIVGYTYDYPDKKSIPNYSTIDIITINTSCVDDFIELNKHYLLYVPVGKLYKAEIIRTYNLTFDESYSYGEDLLFNYAYLEHVQIIANINDCKYHYRQICGSLSHRVRHKKFEIDYFQWKVQKVFYERRQMWQEPAQHFLYGRLWGIVYDAIFQYPLLDHKGFNYIRFILNTQEIDNLKEYADLFPCAKWIKSAILHRCAWLFYFFFEAR